MVLNLEMNKILNSLTSTLKKSSYNFPSIEWFDCWGWNDNKKYMLLEEPPLSKYLGCTNEYTSIATITLIWNYTNMGIENPPN